MRKTLKADINIHIAFWAENIRWNNEQTDGKNKGINKTTSHDQVAT